MPAVIMGLRVYAILQNGSNVEKWTIICLGVVSDAMVFVVILELILPYYPLLFEGRHVGQHYFRSFANLDCL